MKATAIGIALMATLSVIAVSNDASAFGTGYPGQGLVIKEEYSWNPINTREYSITDDVQGAYGMQQRETIRMECRKDWTGKEVCTERSW